MNAQDLKNSILQLAIQGKLVEQREEEGTAEELLKQIKAEKEQLIKEKKIKKEKPLPEITDDEIPFDIPESWEWVRLVDLADTCETPFADGPFGSNLKREHYISKPEVRIIQLSNIGENGWKNKNVKYTSFAHAETIKRSKVNIGDIVIAKMMPAGRAIEVPDVDNTYILSSDAVKFVSHKLVYKKYLLNAINSNVFRSQIYAEVQGITRVRTSLTKLKKYLLPLPPLEEQKRIVEKIEELMPYVEKYDKAHSEVEELNKKFPDDMQKSILQFAIQGKLVEQRVEEGTAEELYNQIQEEKAKLIKEGRIKKQQSLAEISEDEIPFDIPESWKWVRFSEIIDVRDGTHDTPKYVAKGVPLVTSKNLKNGEIDFENVKLISVEDAEKINQRSGVENGDILFAMIGSIGNPVLVKKSRDFSIKNMALFKAINSSLLNMEYLFWFLQLEQDFMKKKSAGGVQSFVSLTFLRSYLIPLPPLKEQKRIVAKIEELMPYAKTASEGINITVY